MCANIQNQSANWRSGGHSWATISSVLSCSLVQLPPLSGYDVNPPTQTLFSTEDPVLRGRGRGLLVRATQISTTGRELLRPLGENGDLVPG